MSRRCLIFAGGEPEPYLPEGVVTDGALIIAADKGYENCAALGITPVLVIGDFDSLGRVPEGAKVYPKEKDDTDLMLAVREALSRGCEDITILGAMGGRFDHTFANVQVLDFILSEGGVGRITSVREEVTLLPAGVYAFPKREGWSLSLFAYSRRVTGLTLCGVKYTLENGEITRFFPIGVSNEITSDSAEVSFKTGILLVCQSRL